jgi:spore germination protein
MESTISHTLQQNIEYLENRFNKCDDLVKKKFLIGKNQEHQAYLIYADGLTDSAMVQENVLRPLLTEPMQPYPKSIGNWIIESADRKQINDMEEAVTNILAGNTLLFLEQCSFAVLISSKKFPTRGIQTPEQEVSIRGPKDSFNENLRTGTALVRRRIRDTRLKVEQVQIGVRSKTDLAILYMKDLVQESVLKQLKEELNEISIDGILDSGMLEQLLEKKVNSPFPQYQHTERPDKVSSGILEGRIAVIVDNSPEVLLLPVTLNVFFQAGDDYYNRWETAAFARILRYLSAIIAISLPGMYIAVADFHTEILPTNLILSFAKAREQVPFPVAVEVLLMELSFELLREAGIRLPGQLGGTIGIVGGLIVGQAAVEAGLVSTIVVIIVSLTAIASFSIPNESFRGAFRLLKFFMIAICTLWGLYGYFLGWLAIAIHLCTMENYGVPYLSPTVNGGREVDYLLRYPWKKLQIRPQFTKEGARRRQKKR